MLGPVVVLDHGRRLPSFFHCARVKVVSILSQFLASTHIDSNQQPPLGLGFNLISLISHLPISRSFIPKRTILLRPVHAPTATFGIAIRWLPSCFFAHSIFLVSSSYFHGSGFPTPGVNQSAQPSHLTTNPRQSSISRARPRDPVVVTLFFDQHDQFYCSRTKLEPSCVRLPPRRPFRSRRPHPRPQFSSLITSTHCQ